MYSVKEMFYTLQGEGRHAGRPAVFLRFSGCNLWSGREQDRAKAQCAFCDTEFVGTDGDGGGRFATASALAEAAFSLWPEPLASKAIPFVVCTGGEPLLQLDAEAIAALKNVGFEVAVESNGTVAAPAGIDWLCISPKAGNPIKQLSGDELKLVFPQAGLNPADFVEMDFGSFRLSPMDASYVSGMPDADAKQQSQRNTEAAVDYCKRHPQWQLSLQTHKILDIP